MQSELFEEWGKDNKTIGEMRTLLKILLGLDDHTQICDFVLMANVYTGDDDNPSHHVLGVPERGLVFTSVDPDQLHEYVKEAMRQL